MSLTTDNLARQNSRHPRRPPANRSVSLLHPSMSPRGRSGLSDLPPSARHGSSINRPSSSPSSLKPLVGKHSSGESSNADMWFDKSNHHASAASRVDHALDGMRDLSSRPRLPEADHDQMIRHFSYTSPPPLKLHPMPHQISKAVKALRHIPQPSHFNSEQAYCILVPTIAPLMTSEASSTI